MYRNRINGIQQIDLLLSADACQLMRSLPFAICCTEGWDGTEGGILSDHVIGGINAG